MIIDRVEAEVDYNFRRVNILTITLSGMCYLFYYTEITIRQETLREWCWWGRGGFLGETKSFAKTTQIWFQNVRLDLIKKTMMVSFRNRGVIGILMRRNMCFSAAIVTERLTDSTRTHINTAHVIVEIVSRR